MEDEKDTGPHAPPAFAKQINGPRMRWERALGPWNDARYARYVNAGLVNA